MRSVVSILCLTTLVMITHVYAQNTPEDYLNASSQQFLTGSSDLSIASCRYILQHFPDDALYIPAAKAIGYIYFATQKYDSAVYAFQAILSDSNILNKGKCSRYNCADFDDLQNEVCERLSESYVKLAMYDSALLYLSYSDTLYPLVYWCGNGAIGHRYELALKYSTIYLLKGDKERAIKCLLPFVFSGGFNGISPFVSELHKLLLNRKELASELDSAIAHVETKRIVDEYDDYEIYRVTFLQTNISVDYRTDFNRPDRNKENFAEHIRSTAFYKMIHDL